jgi:hypothetical protein
MTDALSAAPNGSGLAATDAAAAQRNGAQVPELYELLNALEVMRGGDFFVRLPNDHDGVLGKISVLFNEIAGANQTMAQQLERIGKVVGAQGCTRQRVKFGISTAAWGEMEASGTIAA